MPILISGLHWCLHSIYPTNANDRYHGHVISGIALDTEYAVATDGSCLVAHPAVEGSDPLPPMWRIRPVYPDKISVVLVAEVPAALGHHAILFRDPNIPTLPPVPALVEVADVGSPFYDWRKLMPAPGRKDATVRVDAGIVNRVALSLRGDDRFISLAFEPGSLAVGIARYNGSIGLVMPVRSDDAR